MCKPRIRLWIRGERLHIDHILRGSGQIAADILHNTVQQPLTALLGSPGDMGSDDAVGCSEQGIGYSHGFLADHIHSGAGQLAGG